MRMTYHECQLNGVPSGKGDLNYASGSMKPCSLLWYKDITEHVSHIHCLNKINKFVLYKQ